MNAPTTIARLIRCSSWRGIELVPTLQIDLKIRPEEYLAWYEGTAGQVVARSREGLTVQFPAKVLQRFVGADGIEGTFLLTFDESNKFVRIDKLGVTGESKGFDSYG